MRLLVCFFGVANAKTVFGCAKTVVHKSLRLCARYNRPRLLCTTVLALSLPNFFSDLLHFPEVSYASSPLVPRLQLLGHFFTGFS